MSRTNPEGNPFTIWPFTIWLEAKPSALDDVMGQAGEDDAGEPWRRRDLQMVRADSIRCTGTVILAA